MVINLVSYATTTSTPLNFTRDRTIPFACRLTAFASIIVGLLGRLACSQPI